MEENNKDNGQDTDEVKEPVQEPETEEKAANYMEAQKLNEIWRCPVFGYWFSRKDYADDHAKKTGKRLEHYKRK